MTDETVVIDPRAFISPPFIQCPACGARQGLGVLHIYPDHFTRRCRECLRPAGDDKRLVVPLPSVRKYVLYLDQFAISNAMYRSFPELDPARYAKGAQWHEFFVKVQRLVQVQALVCPSSGFHVDEALPFVHGSALQRTWTTLSAGTRFDDAAEIEGKQLVRLAELWDRGEQPDLSVILKDVVLEPSPHGWTERLQVIVDLGFYDGIKEEVASARSSLSRSLHDLFDEWSRERPEFADQLEAELAAYGPAILATVLKFEATKVEFWSGSGALPLPSNPVLHFKALEYTFRKLGHDEDQATARAVAYLQSEFVKHLPRVRLSALLYAGLARKIAGGMNPSRIGDGISRDIAMVATLLPYCDAMLVDRFVGGLLSEQPTVSYVSSFGTKVFSAATLAQLERWLDHIALGLEDDHLTAISDVYGSDVVEAFRREFAL